MIFGFPIWIVALMIWCELSEKDDSRQENEKEEV